MHWTTLTVLIPRKLVWISLCVEPAAVSGETATLMSTGTNQGAILLRLTIQPFGMALTSEGINCDDKRLQWHEFIMPSSLSNIGNFLTVRRYHRSQVKARETLVTTT